jgi:hypothetical protein
VTLIVALHAAYWNVTILRLVVALGIALTGAGAFVYV